MDHPLYSLHCVHCWYQPFPLYFFWNLPFSGYILHADIASFGRKSAGLFPTLTLTPTQGPNIIYVLKTIYTFPSVLTFLNRGSYGSYFFGDCRFNLTSCHWNGLFWSFLSQKTNSLPHIICLVSNKGGGFVIIMSLLQHSHMLLLSVLQNFNYRSDNFMWVTSIQKHFLRSLWIIKLVKIPPV